MMGTKKMIDGPPAYKAIRSGICAQESFQAARLRPDHPSDAKVPLKLRDGMFEDDPRSRIETPKPH